MSEYNEENEIKPDKNGNFSWQCFVCGAIIEQSDKPDFCPICKKEETFFFIINPDKI